jgi:3-phenylpropionate/trans-cinnamate dioxygenase ferredoxin subunit
VTRVRVCSLQEVPPGSVRLVRAAGREIALANLGEAGLRAIDAICSHAHEYVTEGELDPQERTIECPKHGSTFDLDTGRPRSLPATQPVEVFEVITENDDVWIEVRDGE